MNQIANFAKLTASGLRRVSEDFFMRDTLHGEVSTWHGIPNCPDDYALVVDAGERPCQLVLASLLAAFGRISIRSVYRSSILCMRRAFDIPWYEGSSNMPVRCVDPPTGGALGERGAPNFNGDHSAFYRDVARTHV